MLEYCVREDLKPKAPRYMAVIDPIKLIIDNYPEGQVEWLDASNNPENEEMGSRKIPFSRELYIEREDFMEEPPKKYFRLFLGNEVRLMNAYFVTCVDYKKDENGKVTEIHVTYDPETKSGSGFEGRKVKGTIHWVSASHATKCEARLYEQLVDEERNINPNSLTVREECYVEPALAEAKPYDRFQFVRQGYFSVDPKDSVDGKLVFNRIVSLKSSFKLPS
jgi:glutaminyl-tRNA synthetase